ncbi:MAG: HlyC/CorC family transporter [Lachnospiraceae bacterium]|jgi:CBS domain containing-hemolysin-like protein|nr:HlyC/CorC family transporter [Lachnospiraceae bacterium]
MNTAGLLQIIFLVILIILSGFFSSAESAFTTVNKIRIRALAGDGNHNAMRVEKILGRYSKMLSTVLVGNNIVNISASALATTLAINIWGSVAVSIMTGVLTLVILLFGEIIPKTWATVRSEQIALSYSRIIWALMFILTPLVYIIDKMSHFIMKIFKIDTSGSGTQITENEIKTYVDVGREDGVIESEEQEMINNVFDFSDAVAKDIMIPRIDMTSVDVNTDYYTLMNVFRDSMFTRIPVYDGEPDQIIGLINIKDFFLVKDKKNFHIKSIIRTAYFTFEFKKIADLMIEMRSKAFNVAFVLSEYGTTVGMITMEDLVEEIVGEIRDEYDEDENELIQQVDDRQYIVAGSVKLDDLNDVLGTSLSSEDYDSIGGLMIEQLERLPHNHETITLDCGITLTAQGISDQRIDKVILLLSAEDDPDRKSSDTPNDKDKDKKADEKENDDIKENDKNKKAPA